MISIVIPAHNEEFFIAKLLNQLDKQKLSKHLYEVIVVDNCSNDDTVQQIWKFSKAHPLLNLRLIHERTLGVSRSKNIGGFNAQYPNLVFLDADNSVSVNFLSVIYEIALQENILASTIKTIPDEFNFKMWLFFSLLEKLKQLKFKPFGKSFIKKYVFKDIGGFNNMILLGENVDLLIRAKEYINKQNKIFFHQKEEPIKCSLRRFHRTGFFSIILPWFIAYIGITTLSYKTITEISKKN